MAAEPPRKKPRSAEEEASSSIISVDIPSLNALVKNMLTNIAEPAINSALPSLMRGSVRLLECTLQGVSPNIGPISCRRRDDRTSVIDICIDAALGVKIRIGLAKIKIPIGLDRVEFRGTLSLALRELVRPPFFAGMELYFASTPEIEFHFSGLGSVAECPGIRGLVRSCLMGVFCNQLVLPARFVADFDPEDKITMADLQYPNPVGAVEFTVKSASHLPALDISAFGTSASDPYVIVQCGQDVWQSSTVKKCLNPVWTFRNVFRFLVYEKAQMIRCTVYDEDFIGSDVIGETRGVSVEELVGHGRAKETLLPLTHSSKSRGSLVVAAEWLAPGRPPSLSGQSHQLFIVARIQSATGIPEGFQHPFTVSMSLGGVSEGTTGISRSCKRSAAAASELEAICSRLAAKGMPAAEIGEVIGLGPAAVRTVLAGGGGTAAKLAAVVAAREVEGCVIFDDAVRLSVQWAEEMRREHVIFRMLDKRGKEVGKAVLAELEDFAWREEGKRCLAGPFELRPGLLLTSEVQVVWLGTKEMAASSSAVREIE